MNRGEVWWVEQPDAKRRPYLVLTRSRAIPVLERVMAVPATSTIRGIPTEVQLDERDGLARTCVLSFDNIETLPKWGFLEHIATLSDARMSEVCDALAAAADCSDGHRFRWSV